MIGHSILDGEHRNLLGFAMFCVITCPHFESRSDCERCETGNPEQCRNGLHNILNHLLPDMQKHFEDEEVLMHLVGLLEKNPGYMAAHINAHSCLLLEFRDIAKKLITCPTGNDMIKRVKQLHDLIADRLLEHFHKTDAILVPYLSE